MAELDFPQTPRGTLAELWTAVIGLLPQLGRRPVVRRDISVATVETAVAHGLPFAPQVAIPVRQGNVSVWESRRPDTKYAYLIAASATTVNVVIIP